MKISTVNLKECVLCHSKVNANWVDGMGICTYCKMGKKI